MENKTTGILLAGFMMLLIGIFLLTTSADEVYVKTRASTMVNETIDVTTAKYAGAPVGVPAWNTTRTLAISQAYVTNTKDEWKKDYGDCAITATNYTNGSTGGFQITDYTLTAAGYVSFLNTSISWNLTNGGNSTLITYTYCPDNYIGISWARTVLFVTIGILGIALMIISVGIFYSILKSEGWLDKI